MQTIYSKSTEEYPIKNGQQINCMRVDHRNNIYLAVGGSLHIYSLRRLGANKDWLLCILHMNELTSDSNPADLITESFKLPTCREAATALIDTASRGTKTINPENKLMDSKNLAARAIFLNSKNPHISSISLSQSYSPEPVSLCITLNDRSMLLLKHGKDGYQSEKKPQYQLRNVRVAQYVWQNVIAVLTNQQLIVAPDTMSKVLLDSTIQDGVLAMEGCQTGRGTFLFVMLYPQQLFIANGSITGKTFVQKTIKLPLMCDFLQFGKGVIMVGSSTSLYVLKIGNEELHQVKVFPPQKIFSADGDAIRTSHNLSQQHIVKAVAHTTNKLNVLAGVQLGGSHKQCDLLIQAPAVCFDLLQQCLLQLQQYEQQPSWPVNFHDIRLLRNKVVFSQLLDTVLMLYDSSVVEGIRNIKQRKMNTALSHSASTMVEQLKLRNPKLLITKLLINLLVIVRKEQGEFLEKLILEEVQAHLKKQEMVMPNLQNGQIFKRCADTLQRLGNHSLLQCQQCKLYRINSHPDRLTDIALRVCYVCWGEIQPIA